MLDRLPVKLQDIYFLPEYVRLYRSGPEDRAYLFVYERAKDLWLYPFLFRPILQGNGFDIETAYGYGGPLANTNDDEFLVAAHAAFSYWAREHNVVAEFVRLHPILQNWHWLDPKINQEYAFETASLLLSNSISFNSKTRYMLRRAKREGIQIRIGSTKDDWRQFVDLYLRTMTRLGADPFYYFNPRYFSGLYELINAGGGWLLFAEHGGDCVSAAVFLRGANLHYHLSASIDKHIPGAANLLIDTAAQTGKGLGFKRLHLGGGRTSNPDDSLLKFKKSMATDSHAFYVGKRVHNQKTYRELRSSWMQTYPDLINKYGDYLLCYRYYKGGEHNIKNYG